MSIAASIKQTIERIPPGKIFGYEVFSEYFTAPEAVVQAMCRCVVEQRVKRFAKGRFYTPKQGLLGTMYISDDELLRDALYRQGKRRGYITGSALYNRMGLTTQVPKTITVATNRAAQTKDFGTIRIKYTPRRAPITEGTVPLFELLDVLRNAKRVPDTKVDDVVDTIARRLKGLTPADLKKLQTLAVDYYNAATRALLGVILEGIGKPVQSALRASMNPTTHFEFGLDPATWPQAGDWNLR